MALRTRVKTLRRWAQVGTKRANYGLLLSAGGSLAAVGFARPAVKPRGLRSRGFGFCGCVCTVSARLSAALFRAVRLTPGVCAGMERPHGLRRAGLFSCVQRRVSVSIADAASGVDPLVRGGRAPKGGFLAAR